MVGLQESQAKKVPLNEIDQENLSIYFGQNGISSTLDQNVSELLRFKELDNSNSLTNDSTYGAIVLHANDSFFEIVSASKKIQDISSYNSICVELSGVANKNNVSMGELGHSTILARTEIKELTNELDAISNDQAYKVSFDDFRDKYSQFKNDLSDINQYILGKLHNLSEDHFLDVKNGYESLNDKFNNAFNENFNGMYITIKNEDGEKNFLKDFSEHSKQLSDLIKNTSIDNEKSLQNTKDNSIENTF